jgi:hypothetical protein
MMARSISSNTRPDTLVRDHSTLTIFPCNARRVHTLGSSAFRLFTTWGRRHSRARASLRTRHQGPSMMGFEDEVEQSLGRPCRQADGRSKQTRELTSSIVPRGTPFHHSVELEFPPVVIGSTSLSCHCGFPGPAELCAVNPDTVQDHGQPSRQCDNRSFYPAPSGNLHRPGLEPGPFCRT